jgi:hypothetical protein
MANEKQQQEVESSEEEEEESSEEDGGEWDKETILDALEGCTAPGDFAAAPGPVSQVSCVLASACACEDS